MIHFTNPAPLKRHKGKELVFVDNNHNNPMLGSSRVFRTTGAKRPVDKILINVLHNNIDATQVTTVLVTATFPCTVTGLRWDLTLQQFAGVAFGTYAWVIAIVRDGLTIPTLAISDGSTLYKPEQDVLAFGHGMGALAALGMLSKYNGSTKTMRKMMGGDRIIFILVGEATNTASCEGCIQFFCKF